jgi:hypothetical protein
VAAALTRDGWTVWWDRRIPTATEWERVLLPELEKARCVVVLWSGHSVRSDWVRREAEAAADRTVLVPALIETAPIPATTGFIQVADLTTWSGNPAATEFGEFLNAVRERMLPACEIRFQSLLYPEPESIETLTKTLLQVAYRVTGAPRVGVYSPPNTDMDQRRLERTIASVNVTIHWPPELTELFDAATDQDRLAERLNRIPRRIPRLWLDLEPYSGPFQYYGTSFRTHEKYLAFASLSLYHDLFHSSERSGHHMDAYPPLTTQLLSYPRWEGAISVFFEPADEPARAYVVALDDQSLSPEMVIYGPRDLSKRAYRKTLDRSLYTEPVWLEEYFIPQYELLLAIQDPNRIVPYHGNAYIRKVTDLDGRDLPGPFPR